MSPYFHYDNSNHSDSNIVSCFGSPSSIKRGYWFGEVNDKATVTVYPNTYCNFTCCKAANGFVKLSQVRANQYNLQRSGIACGSCKRDYTLTLYIWFYSDNSTSGQPVFVVPVSILHWVFVVTVY